MTRLICGIGYNHKLNPDTETTKRLVARQTWADMIKRCYSIKFQEKHPTYIGCTVADEWHNFENFADWYEESSFSDFGYHLDKDLLVGGNKLYSPDTCCLIPQEINKAIMFRRSNEGGCPYGVSLTKGSKKYKAQLSVNRRRLTLGWFDCPNEAHQVYKEAKERYIRNKALEWANRIEWNVFVALMNWTLDS